MLIDIITTLTNYLLYYNRYNSGCLSLYFNFYLISYYKLLIAIFRNFFKDRFKQKDFLHLKKNVIFGNKYLLNGFCGDEKLKDVRQQKYFSIIEY